MESCIRATVAYDSNGNLLPETRKETNFTFVQRVPETTETFASNDKKNTLPKIEKH